VHKRYNALRILYSTLQQKSYPNIQYVWLLLLCMIHRTSAHTLHIAHDTCRVLFHQNSLSPTTHYLPTKYTHNFSHFSQNESQTECVELLMYSMKANDTVQNNQNTAIKGKHSNKQSLFHLLYEIMIVWWCF
jgi:hypothetical protein